jgi:pimeloyl-ACP methyl ester carboxylesterase
LIRVLEGQDNSRKRIVLRWIKRLLTGLLGITALMVVSGVAFEQWSRWNVERQYKPMGRLVDVDGHRTHLNCSGEGSPTVVLESGLDSFGSLSWSLVQAEIAETNRVCSYDRAGILWSEPRDEIPRATFVADHLHRLLEVADEPPPYLLVGHSLGGPHIRVFADRYGRDVMAMVLVDSSHPEQKARFPKEVTEGAAAPSAILVSVLAETGVLRLLEPFSIEGVPVESHIAFEYAPQRTSALLREVAAIDLVLADAGLVPSLGEMPLVVLSRGKEPEDLPDGLSDEVRLEVARIWSILQAELTTISANSDHRIIDDAGHYIQFDKPSAVIQAIHDVALSARNP